jgi:hypothetical protein
MKTTKEIIIKTVVALCAGFILLIMFNCFSTEKYYPTLEEAFRHHSGGERNMGEILFADEHENNLSLFHTKDGVGGISTFMSHYLKKEKNGRNVYLCISVWESGAILNPNSKSVERFKANIVFFRSGSENVYKLLNRTPEYGFSQEEKIHSLMIDNQLVDEVIEFQSSMGPMYYWYFSDLTIDDFNNIKVLFK